MTRNFPRGLIDHDLFYGTNILRKNSESAKQMQIFAVKNVYQLKEY